MKTKNGFKLNLLKKDLFKLLEVINFVYDNEEKNKEIIKFINEISFNYSIDETLNETINVFNFLRTTIKELIESVQE